MTLFYSEAAGNRRRLMFTKTYKNNYVESAYTEIDLVGDKVVRMDRLWIDVIDETAEREPLPMATQSLLRLLTHESLRGRTIKKSTPVTTSIPKNRAPWKTSPTARGATPPWLGVWNWTEGRNWFSCIKDRAGGLFPCY